MVHATAQFLGSHRPLGPWGGTKGRISLNLNYLLIVNFKYFNPNFVCLLTNERYKTYKTGFSLGPLGHAQGLGTWGAGGQKFNFLNMIMWHIKLKGMNSSP